LVDPARRWRDPERAASVVVDAVAPGKAAPAEWLQEWAGAEAAAQHAIDAVLARHPEPTEPGIARRLLDEVPGGAHVVVSSSMPVRDLEWYGRPRSGVAVHANRGANGIDGVLSTALGVAAAGDGSPTFALVGDLAFVHDVGALALAARRPDLPCTFVVVDNDGGGIFSFLAQASALPGDRFEALFGTPHGLDLTAVATGFGLPVTSLDDALAHPPRRPTVVHMRTDRAANVAVHDELHAAVARAVG
jgi:2-succinyl-5-enolpyruvyl-6-hydroxy-3-cyclohexene-1-carboxylate synthase